MIRPASRVRAKDLYAGLVAAQRMGDKEFIKFYRNLAALAALNNALRRSRRLYKMTMPQYVRYVGRSPLKSFAEELLELAIKQPPIKKSSLKLS